MTAIDWTASWDATKNISPIHIVNGVTAMFLTFFIANYVDDYAGDGIIRRLARGVGAAIVYAVFGGIALVGMCAVALLAFHLMKLGPTMQLYCSGFDRST